MQIVQALAGYSLGRADLVRRAMSKKKASVMEKERQNFVYGNEAEGVPGCIKNGIDEKTANKIYDEMIDFAKYAFNKSHAAAYAFVSYQTAWLKYYYPVEFMAALMTSCIDNPGKVAEYILSSRQMGISILPPDINRSEGKFTVDGQAIRYGMAAVMAGELGHTVTKIRPALIPLVCAEPYCRELQGLSLKNIEIHITDGKKKLYDEFGEMLFTHYGVTGPVILSASSIVGKTLEKKELVLHIDLKPALTEEQLDKRLLREFEANHNKQFKNAIDSLLPAKLRPVIIELSGIEEEKKVHEITKEERLNLLRLIKDFHMTLTGLRGYNEAIITKGGISVKEIDPGTMESKLIKNLYFAGEVLDLDAVTGGYNLQIAWSTGYLAGISAGQDKLFE